MTALAEHTRACEAWAGHACTCRTGNANASDTNPWGVASGERQASAPDQPPDVPSWGRIDLTPYLDGSHVPQVPELLARTDGPCLLYRGRVHSFHGESESGKSWVALIAAADILTTSRGRVVMLDYESDADTVVGRLLALGVPAETIRARFDYRRPEGSPMSAHEAPEWEELLRQRADLVIIDGVTEALATVGVKTVDNDEVTVWLRSIAKRLARATGAAVVLVDHVGRDADTRGRFAIGAQAKMMALDGPAYILEILDPLGVGMVGRISMRIGKDRPGQVRPHCGKYRRSDRTQEAAVVTLDSRTPGASLATVDPPRTDTSTDPDGAGPGWRPTVLMVQVTEVLEKAGAAMSRKGIETAVPGRAQYVRQAIDALLTDGYLAADGPSLGGHPSIRLVKPYREDTPPAAPENLETVR